MDGWMEDAWLGGWKSGGWVDGVWMVGWVADEDARPRADWPLQSPPVSPPCLARFPFLTRGSARNPRTPLGSIICP